VHETARPRHAARVNETAKRVSWLELFFDLVFVAAVGQVGHSPGGATTVEALVRQVFLLVLIWWAWHGYVGHATRFDPDRAWARVCTLLQMVAVVFMAANAEDTLDSESTAGFVAAYGVMRLLLAVQYAGEWHRLPRATWLRRQITWLVAAGLVWLVSAIVPVPWRYAVWGLAALVEAWLERHSISVALASPPHADHLPERFGLFTLILLGEALVSVMRGIQHQPVWSVPAASAALGSLALIFLLWWVYFDWTRATTARPVQTRADVSQLVRWTYAHLPLYLGLAILGGEAARLIAEGGRFHVEGAHWAQSLASLSMVTVALVVLGTSDRLRREDALS
jgi:low temperature requirement protein LtrA